MYITYTFDAYTIAIVCLARILEGALVILCARAFYFSRSKGYLVIGSTYVLGLILGIFGILEDNGLIPRHEPMDITPAEAQTPQSPSRTGQIRSPIRRPYPRPKFPIGLVCVFGGIWILERREKMLGTATKPTDAGLDAPTTQ